MKQDVLTSDPRNLAFGNRVFDRRVPKEDSPAGPRDGAARAKSWKIFPFAFPIEVEWQTNLAGFRRASSGAGAKLWRRFAELENSTFVHELSRAAAGRDMGIEQLLLGTACGRDGVSAGNSE